MTPFQMKAQNNLPNEVLAANIEATIKRGYTVLRPEGCSGPVSIVGAGPSLASTYRDLVGDVMACNSAHDFLIGKGIVPKYAMLWDGSPIMAGMLKPHKGVQYLVASRCHSSVFDMLRGHDVRVWHALGDDILFEIMKRHGLEEMMIAGGSSSVLRAAYVAGSMGYRQQMHLFGVDSSYSGKKTHVAGSLVAQDKQKMYVGGRWFYAATWMIVQAQDFKNLMPMLKANGIRVTVHGTGLIPHLASFMDIPTPDIRLGWIERNLSRRFLSLHSLYMVLRTSPQLLGGFNARV